MTDHTLKTLDLYWEALASGVKTFEVRKNDRAFQKGDKLILQRWEDGRFGLRETTPKRVLIATVTYLLQGGQFGIEPAYCVLGLKGVREI